MCPGSTGDATMKVFFVGLVIVDTQDDITAAYEPELWCSVVESGDLKYVTDSVTVKSWEIFIRTRDQVTTNE